MIPEEQERIMTAIGGITGLGMSITKNMTAWAQRTFAKDGHIPEIGHCGLLVQYRVAAVNKWFHLHTFTFSSYHNTHDDARHRKEEVKGLFFFSNLESSNAMGDVTEVRCVPYIGVDGKDEINETEARLWDCTDTQVRRKWNHLEFKIYTKPSGGVNGYYLVKDDIHEGRDICWYQPWHFSLEDDTPCPVGPIIIEKSDDYELVIRYRGKLHTIGMELDKPHSVTLIEDAPVTPTHNWGSGWLRPPYTFTLELALTWERELYGSSNKHDFQQKPHYVRTSDLPADVRTREQIDHDAWEEAVRSGALNNKTYS